MKIIVDPSGDAAQRAAQSPKLATLTAMRLPIATPSWSIEDIAIPLADVRCGEADAVELQRQTDVVLWSFATGRSDIRLVDAPAATAQMLDGVADRPLQLPPRHPSDVRNPNSQPNGSRFQVPTTRPGC